MGVLGAVKIFGILGIVLAVVGPGVMLVNKIASGAASEVEYARSEENRAAERAAHKKQMSSARATSQALQERERDLEAERSKNDGLQLRLEAATQALRESKEAAERNICNPGCTTFLKEPE